jgi:5-formyltetrahydrofolate cyclo-ligase
MANQGSYYSEKSRLRRTVRERLKQIDLGDRHRRSLQICEKLTRLLAGKKSVALFAPRPTEPDLDLLWDSGSMEDRLVSYPRCDAERLLYFAVSNLQELHPGRFGVREPDPKRPVQHHDAIVLPGLAFTESGTRIGQGAGFYDRFLETVRADTIKIGVCFDFQIVGDVPREEHDADVDLLVCA